MRRESGKKFDDFRPSISRKVAARNLTEIVDKALRAMKQNTFPAGLWELGGTPMYV